MASPLEFLMRLFGGEETTLRFVEGGFEIQCPACQSWLPAKIHSKGVAVSHVNTDQGLAHVEVELHPVLCAHGHECPVTAELAQGLIARFEEDHQPHGNDQDPG